MCPGRSAARSRSCLAPIDGGRGALQILFFIGGVAVMVAFVRNGMRVEPFTAAE